MDASFADGKRYCEERKVGNKHTVTKCYCNTDLCNRATVLRRQASPLIAILILVVTLLAKAFACPIFNY